MEAIEFLKKQEPLPVLVYSKEVEKAAQAHAEDLERNSQCAHVGGDGNGPTQRVGKQLKWTKMVAECIEVCGKAASDIICSLIVDDGNEERSNRKVLFSKNCHLVGVSCVPHPIYGILTVINFIGGYQEAKSAETPMEPTPQPVQY